MSDELIKRVISVIAATQKMEPEKITIDSTFEELGIDSLDGVQLLFALETEFNINIPDEGAQGLHGVREMVEALSKLMPDGPVQQADATAQS
jgi:acyl carrier protein